MSDNKADLLQQLEDASPYTTNSVENVAYRLGIDSTRIGGRRTCPYAIGPYRNAWLLGREKARAVLVQEQRSNDQNARSLAPK